MRDNVEHVVESFSTLWGQGEGGGGRVGASGVVRFGLVWSASVKIKC